MKKILADNLKFLYRRISNPSPVIILGMPKSGTTVIAALLGKRTGQKTLLDTPLFWHPYTFSLLKKEIFLKKHLKQHSSLLSYKILKEPNFTLLFEDFYKLFPKAKFIYIVRKPEDNIRSILNRIGIAGSMEEFTDYSSLDKGWHGTFNDYYSDKTHYIEKLSDLWVKYTNIYLAKPEKFILVRYEDFIDNKEMVIDGVVSKIKMQAKFDIASDVNKQFQPKGNSTISYDDFFKGNLCLISDICAENASAFSYI